MDCCQGGQDTDQVAITHLSLDDVLAMDGVTGDGLWGWFIDNYIVLIWQDGVDGSVGMWFWESFRIVIIRELLLVFKQLLKFYHAAFLLLGCVAIQSEIVTS